MKNKLIFIIFYFAIIYNSFAQRPITNSYKIDNYIDKFVGTWVWTQGNDSVIIKLLKIKDTLDLPTRYADKLIGCHKYVKSGQVIENSLNRWDSVVTYHNYKGATLYGGTNRFLNDTSKIECTLRDISKYTKHKLILHWMTGTTETLIWTLTEKEGILVDPRQQIGLTLPANLVLTKQ